MVQIYRADDTDLPVLLLMQLFGNGFKRSGTGDVYIDHTGISFISCGSRVRSKAARIIGDSGSFYGKIHKIQANGTIEDSAVSGIILCAGKSVRVIRVGYSAQIIRSCLELRITHTIPDKQKYILGSGGSLYSSIG